LAIVVPANTILATDIEQLIQEKGAPLLTRVMLFDRYVGPQIAEGHVGFTYSLEYRSLERTLTDAEVAEVHHCIIDALRSYFGIQIR
jgi:phenylalanyl-tRNA synthetase beta chain